jgi:hypothetical protein
MVSTTADPGGSPPDEGGAQPAQRSTWSLPAGHTMPENYKLLRDGIFQEVPRTDRQGNPVEAKFVRVSYGPLAVVRKYASADGEQWFDVAWHDGRRTVVRRVSGATLRGGVKLVRELGSIGIPLFEGNAGKAEQYLAAYLVTNAEVIEDNVVKLARYLGWQSDGTFVSSDGAPCPVEVAHVEQEPILSAYRPAGTLKQWQASIAPVERYPTVRIALAAAFAPALFAPLRLRSCAVDISGRSTRGKSTAAAVGLSVWANPSEEFQAWGTWKSGMIGIEKRLNLMRGLPVVLDETRVVKHADLVDQVLYQVPMDHGTARGGNYTSASMLPWNTLVLSTGEQPALSFTSHEGAAARVISLRRPPFGREGERSAADAEGVRLAILTTYGTAGPAFAARLIEMLAEQDGLEQLRKRHDVLADEHSGAAGNDVARRRSRHVAAIHLATQLAHEWGIVPFGALETADWTELLSEEEAREDRGAMALEVVRALIASQGHRVQPLSTGKIGAAAGALTMTPPGGWIGAHVEDRNGQPAVALLPGDLDRALSANRPPIVLDAVKEAWTEAGTIAMDPKRPKSLDRAYISGKRVRAFIFTSATLDGPDDEEQSGQSDQDATDPRTQQEALPAPSAHPEQPALDNGWGSGTIGEDVNS